ncbi:MAG: DUF2461 domain-containing protein [Chitinophagaceae bacterium]|nr:DUF2461 domain-containing protein [Chitinophagaceae bacterium]
MLQPSTLKFLKDLKKNNNKPWFDANRKAYEAAKTDFAGFIDTVIEAYGKKDPSIAQLKAKDCMFRINRDVRFSKDKSPYKTNFGASINKGGKKSMTAGYYFHLEPGESFTGGGLYMAMPDQLKNIRQEIDYSWKEFHKIISTKQFKTVYGDLYMGDDMKLVRPPKGYEADNPAIEYIKLKSWIGFSKLSNSDLISNTLLKKTVTSFEVLKPLLDFLNQGLEPG